MKSVTTQMSLNRVRKLTDERLSMKAVLACFQIIAGMVYADIIRVEIAHSSRDRDQGRDATSYSGTLLLERVPEFIAALPMFINDNKKKNYHSK